MKNKMLNVEGIDKMKDGNGEITFSDDNADMVLKIIVSKRNAMDLARMIQDKFSYKADK